MDADERNINGGRLETGCAQRQYITCDPLSKIAIKRSDGLIMLYFPNQHILQSSSIETLVMFYGTFHEFESHRPPSTPAPFTPAITPPPQPIPATTTPAPYNNGPLLKHFYVTIGITCTRSQ